MPLCFELPLHYVAVCILLIGGRSLHAFVGLSVDCSTVASDCTVSKHCPCLACDAATAINVAALRPCVFWGIISLVSL